MNRLQRSTESRTEFEINLLQNAVTDIHDKILDRHVAHQQYYHHIEHQYPNISFEQKYLVPRLYSGNVVLNIFDYLKEIVQERDCKCFENKRPTIFDPFSVARSPQPVNFGSRALAKNFENRFGSKAFSIS